jgi:hypothetical protein
LIYSTEVKASPCVGKAVREAAPEKPLHFLEEKMKSLKMMLRDLFYSLYLRYAGQFQTAQQIAEAKMHGNVLENMERAIVKSQTKCNHRKGGVIVRVAGETTKSAKIAECLQGGTASQYSVMKHQMMNGDWRIRCTRCGKTWTAPIRQEYRNDREFWAAIEEYEAAVNFPTNNVSSTSLQFRWRYRDGSDGSEVPRKAMAARV